MNGAFERRDLLRRQQAAAWTLLERKAAAYDRIKELIGSIRFVIVDLEDHSLRLELERIIEETENG